jgi:hypothetical protein
VRSDKVFVDGSNKKWWIGISYREFNVCIKKFKRVRLEYILDCSTNLELDIIIIMKQLKWIITRTFCYLGTFIYAISACIFWMFEAFTWPMTKQRGYFDFFFIFSTSLFVNVYCCNDISLEITNSRTISEPLKIIPVCIQYDKTDANLEFTVYGYD